MIGTSALLSVYHQRQPSYLYQLLVLIAICMASHMASSSQYGSPGFPPGYSPYNTYQSTRQWGSSPSPQYQQDFPKRPLSGRPPSKNSLQPLIHDYGPTPPYINPSPSAFSRFMTFFFNWWLCILSILVSLVSIAIITILLFFINNRTISTLPLNIALNTYISFFCHNLQGLYGLRRRGVYLPAQMAVVPKAEDIA